MCTTHNRCKGRIIECKSPDTEHGSESVNTEILHETQYTSPEWSYPATTEPNNEFNIGQSACSLWMNITLQKVAINAAMLLEAGHSSTAVPLTVNFIVLCFYLSATRSHSRAQNCIKFGKFLKRQIAAILNSGSTQESRAKNCFKISNSLTLLNIQSTDQSNVWVNSPSWAYVPTYDAYLEWPVSKLGDLTSKKKKERKGYDSSKKGSQLSSGEIKCWHVTNSRH